MTSQTIWGSTDRGPATSTMRMPVDINSGSGPGYLTVAELSAYMWGSPTLVTPVLGVATATSINKVAITQPLTGSTLTIDDTYTLHVNANATVSGTNTGDQTDATLSFTDITTNNSSTSKHGFLKKLNNDATYYMDGTGNWSVPPGGGGSGTVTTVSVATANGISGSVANATTTPTITLTLGAITPSSIAVGGVVTVTSTSASSLIVGPNGATNPVLKVDSSQASQADGCLITGYPAGTGTTISAISSGSNTPITLQSLGTGIVNLASNGTGTTSGIKMVINGGTRYQFFNTGVNFIPNANSSASTTRLNWASAANTSITAGTELQDVVFNQTAIQQYASNSTVALHRGFRIATGSIAFVSATGTVTNAAGFSVDGALSGGTNASITNSHAIYVPTIALTGTVVNGYGLTVVAPSGASNNYAAQFTGKVGISTAAPTAALHLPAGTATAGTSPLKMTSGTNLTTGEAGTFEYNGTNLFFTRTGTTRETNWCGNDAAAAPSTTATPTFTSYYGGNTKALGDPNSWASVNIGGTTYKVPLYT